MAPESAAFDRGVRPLLQLLLLERAPAVMEYRPDPALRARIDELAEKATENELTAEERAEYEGYIRANQFIAVLLRQARRIVGAES